MWHYTSAGTFTILYLFTRNETWFSACSLNSLLLISPSVARKTPIFCLYSYYLLTKLRLKGLCRAVLMALLCQCSSS